MLIDASRKEKHIIALKLHLYHLTFSLPFHSCFHYRSLTSMLSAYWWMPLTSYNHIIYNYVMSMTLVHSKYTTQTNEMDFESFVKFSFGGAGYRLTVLPRLIDFETFWGFQRFWRFPWIDQALFCTIELVRSTDDIYGSSKVVACQIESGVLPGKKLSTLSF